MNEGTLVLLAGVGAGVIYKVLDALKKSGKVQKELLPIVSVIVAALVGAILAVVVHESVFMGAFLGIMTGSMPVAGHQIKKSVKKITHPNDQV